MKFLRVRSILPDWKNALAALVSAILLIGAFPDFEFWFLAWFALVPLLWAVEREKESAVKSFVLGWIFGTVFFFGTCWWLTFAPINYAGFPPALAYLLMFGVTAIVGVFPGIFAGILSFRFRSVGPIAIGSAPTVWIFAEFLRYWVTGNNWNSIGYSMAFNGSDLLFLAPYGGVFLVGLLPLSYNAMLTGLFFILKDGQTPRKYYIVLLGGCVLPIVALYGLGFFDQATARQFREDDSAAIVAIQPNVPMSGLTYEKWKQLRQRHVLLAESALTKLNEQRTTNNYLPTTVIFPESPMNFMYEDDPETQEFINSFAAKNNVSVLFNSAEPDLRNGKFFNSAVIVGPEGKEIGQYDKIYLVPFGESVPAPLQNIVPAFVGSFSYGNEYDLFPLGDAKAGVMICFESHFGQLSREYVLNGADVIIEMTNDGYLGPTPVLRQHLANAVFRAVETNRPLLRVTNVGITAYINERGEVLDPAVPYTEDTRVWSVSKSDGSQTFYVKYGDWFAWLCSVVTIGLLLYGNLTRKTIVNAGD
ncbi:MAG: apolipoprotein N-acyltransferase [Pyrinomonadaceae bacterium]